MYGIVLRNFQKHIQNVYKTYSFRIQISYRDKFFALFEMTANIASNLHKELESSSLPISERNLSFFRNVLNYLTPYTPGSLNCSEEIAF